MQTKIKILVSYHSSKLEGLFAYSKMWQKTDIDFLLILPHSAETEFLSVFLPAVIEITTP
jgi:hypothetical protein